MEYHNYHTPLDRIDESFVRELLAGEDFANTASCGCSDEKINNNRYTPKKHNTTCTQARREHSGSCRRRTCDISSGNTAILGDCAVEGDFNPPKLEGVPYAMVYSPYQSFENLYDEETGFTRGTIFKCLDLPFYPTPCSGASKECRDIYRRK